MEDRHKIDRNAKPSIDKREDGDLVAASNHPRCVYNASWVEARFLIINRLAGTRGESIAKKIQTKHCVLER